MTGENQIKRSGLSVTKQGEDWMVNAPGSDPIFIPDRKLAYAIFDMAVNAYFRGRDDGLKDVRDVLRIRP